MRRRILMCLILLSGAAPAQIITGGGGGGGGSVGPPGPAGEVTSPAGTYTVDGLVLFNATSGDSIKASTGTGFPFLTAGTVSTVGTTGTGAVVLSVAPTMTGNMSVASMTGQAAGVIDFSNSGFLRVPTFTTGAPPTDCDEATEVGRIRLRSQDSATANGGLRVCQQLVGATYGWMPLGYKTASTAPATCAVGDMYMNTTLSTPAGRQLYLCTVANTWTLAGDGGGGATVATTTSALKGDGAGNAIAVTGTATDCVKVDGSSGACGTGPAGSGGNGFIMTVNTGADTVTLTASRLVSFVRGIGVTQVQAGETFTWTNATAAGDYIIYYDGGMRLSGTTATVASASTTSSRPISSIVNATTGLQLPQGAIPLFAGTITGTAFVNTSTSLYASDAAPFIMDVDASMTMTTVGTDTLRFSSSSTGSPGSSGTGYTITPSALTGAALQTAITSVPAIGGTVWVPRGTYALGATGITVAQSANKVHILCEPGAVFTYSGTGTAFLVGGDLGNTEYFRMEGCEINVSGTSNAAVVALKMIRSFWGNVKNVKIMSANGAATGIQTGIMISGGDGCSGAPGCGSPSQAGFSAYNILENVAVIGSWLKGIHFNSEISGGPASRDRSNRNTIIGGSVYSSAVSKTGTVGIHIEHGDTNYVLQTDMDSVETGVKADSANSHISVKCEGPTVSGNCVWVTSTSQGTYVAGVNAATGRFLDQGFETQFIIASQGGVLASRLANLRAMYSFQLDPRPDTPATLADGMMWYDYTLNKFRCRENGATMDCFREFSPGASDTTIFSERQEFSLYTSSTIPWNLSGTGCSAAAQAAENGHPGMIRLTTASGTANAPCSYWYPVNPNTIGFLPPIGTGGDFTSFVTRWIFRSGPVTANTAIAVGLDTDAAAGAIPTQQSGANISFRVDNFNTTTCSSGATSIPAGRWHFAMRPTLGGNWHCIDTALDASTLALANSTWYEAVIWSTAAGTVNFGVKVSGGAIKAYGSTSSSSIPITTLKPSFAVTTINTTAKSMDIDFWSGYMTGLSR